MHLGFVDLKCAFDSVNHGALEKAMRNLGIHDNDVRLAKAMLEKQSHRCITPHGLTDRVHHRNGTAQGSAESPCLFAMLLEPLLRELEENYSQHGFAFGEIKVCVQAFADDMVLISENKEGLQQLLDVVGDYCKVSGLRIRTGIAKSATMHFNSVHGATEEPVCDISDSNENQERQALPNRGERQYR